VSRHVTLRYWHVIVVIDVFNLISYLNFWFNLILIFF